MRILLRCICLLTVAGMLFSCSRPKEDSDVYNLKYYQLTAVNRDHDSTFQSTRNKDLIFLKRYYNGKILSTNYFYKGHFFGVLKMYNDSGRISSLVTYKYGVEDGASYTYSNKTGKLKLESYYKNGKLDSVYKQWDDNGVGFDSTVYKDGKDIHEMGRRINQ